MEEEVKERKCKTCGKRLIDEKIPICLRCRLTGRNNVGKVSGIVGMVLAVTGGKALIDQNQNRNDDDA